MNERMPKLLALIAITTLGSGCASTARRDLARVEPTIGSGPPIAVPSTPVATGPVVAAPTPAIAVSPAPVPATVVPTQAPPPQAVQVTPGPAVASFPTASTGSTFHPGVVAMAPTFGANPGVPAPAPTGSPVAAGPATGATPPGPGFLADSFDARGLRLHPKPFPSGSAARGRGGSRPSEPTRQEPDPLGLPEPPPAPPGSEEFAPPRRAFDDEQANTHTDSEVRPAAYREDRIYSAPSAQPSRIEDMPAPNPIDFD